MVKEGKNVQKIDKTDADVLKKISRTQKERESERERGSKEENNRKSARFRQIYYAGIKWALFISECAL